MYRHLNTFKYELSDNFENMNLTQIICILFVLYLHLKSVLQFRLKHVIGLPVGGWLITTGDVEFTVCLKWNLLQEIKDDYINFKIMVK